MRKRHWQTLELIARVAMLFGLALQLTLLAIVQDVKHDSERADILENQAVLAQMIMRPESAVTEYGERFTLYSETLEARASLEREIWFFNAVFLALFLGGGVLELVARYMELRETPDANATPRPATHPTAPPPPATS